MNEDTEEQIIEALTLLRQISQSAQSIAASLLKIANPAMVVDTEKRGIPSKREILAAFYGPGDAGRMATSGEILRPFDNEVAAARATRTADEVQSCADYLRRRVSE